MWFTKICIDSWVLSVDMEAQLVRVCVVGTPVSDVVHLGPLVGRGSRIVIKYDLKSAASDD